jgi:translation initiation factor IF-1
MDDPATGPACSWKGMSVRSRRLLPLSSPAENRIVAKSEPIEVEATVSQALPNAMFKLKLDGSDKEILGIVSGKMRKHFIRILPGDRVKVQISPYDWTKGRIVFRQK